MRGTPFFGETASPGYCDALWWAEAKTKITTYDIGSSVVVLVEGHKVAEFLTWAGLATKTDIGSAAEQYAQTLREAYLGLARGEKS